MLVLGRLVQWVGYVLLAMGAVGLIGLMGMTYWEQGFSGLQELMSPRNIRYYATAIVLLAPGALLIALGEKLIARKKSRNTP